MTNLLQTSNFTTNNEDEAEQFSYQEVLLKFLGYTAWKQQIIPANTKWNTVLPTKMVRF